MSERVTPTEAADRERVSLGDVDPARSRHAGRRSAVAFAGDAVVAGTADGRTVAFDRETLAERWRHAPRDLTGDGATERDDVPGSADATDAPDAAVVAAAASAAGVVVGERSARGRIRCHDPATGGVRWRYDASADVGPPQRDSRFFRPFVVDLVAAGDRTYALARRYARDGDDRRFASVAYAFDADGSVAWRYETDASAIALDASVADDGSGRVAVAYNRCTGAHQHGLVVLDADGGVPRYDWDPGTDGQRRVGDVALVDDGVVLACHGDHRGYRLDDGGDVRWRVDLATPTDVGDETLYAYPNHLHATDAGVAFVTGNTYAVEGRETDGLHPDEHTAFGVALDGDRRWTASVGGFANEVGTDGERVAVPGAQHFRTRDADVHGIRAFDVEHGPVGAVDADGVVTAVALDDGQVAGVEEPVVYHDDGIERGAYRLFLAPA